MVVDNCPLLSIKSYQRPKSSNSTTTEMTTVRQLFEIQELDLELTQARDGVLSIEGELGDREQLDALSESIEAQDANLLQLRAQQGSRQLEADSMREKLGDLESKLYGGAVTSLRELEAAQKEAEFLKEQLQALDDSLLESMLILEDSESRLRRLEVELQEAETLWGKRQADIAGQLKVQRERVVDLEERREAMVTQISQRDLRLYDSLRASKGGQAIAKVERGLCRGCRMALPTHQLQRARAGREPVQCSSCSRILFVS